MNPKFYMVGGSVRDRFMQRQSHDIDWVVVGATPEWMLSNGYKQVGADFPVFLDYLGTEYALARTERKVGSGYHGFETSYDSNVTLEDDLSRRDLTINAMAYDLESKQYIDPFDGRTDIHNKVLKHVSEAFREDPVRVLRLARFAAQLNFTVHENTNAFCQEMVKAGELNHLTKERIWKEFEKALISPYPENFFHVLKQCGALKVVFPLFDKHFAFVINNINSARYPYGENLFARIMTMFNPAIIERFCEDYRVPNEYKDHALFHSKLSRKITMKHYMSPRIIIDILNEFGIYRGHHVMLDAPWDTPYIQNLKKAWEITKSISFQDLTEEQKLNLKGKEIGKAIDDLRAKTLQHWTP